MKDKVEKDVSEHYQNTLNIEGSGKNNEVNLIKLEAINISFLPKSKSWLLHLTRRKIEEIDENCQLTIDSTNEM